MTKSELKNALDKLDKFEDGMIYMRNLLNTELESGKGLPSEIIRVKLDDKHFKTRSFIFSKLVGRAYETTMKYVDNTYITLGLTSQYTNKYNVEDPTLYK